MAGANVSGGVVITHVQQQRVVYMGRRLRIGICG